MKKINLKLVRDIRKHKWQFWSLVLIILLGEMSYGGMTGMIGDVEASVEKTLDDLRFQDFVITLEGTVPESIVEEVAAIDNVAAVTGRLLLNTGLRLDEDVEIHARLIGMPADDQPTVNQINIDEGSYLQRGDVLSAVLDHNFADYKAFGPGTILQPIINGQRISVTVVGVATSPEYLMPVASSENIVPSPNSFAVLFMDQDELQRLAGAEDTINELNIRLNNDGKEQVEQAIVEVSTLLEDATILSVVKREDNPAYRLLKLDLDGGKQMMNIVPFMFLLIAAMSLYVVLSRMVKAQRPEIGVMRALGYSRWAAMRYYLAYGAIIAIVGSVLGFLLSYPAGYALSQGYALELGLPSVSAEFHLDAALTAIAINLMVCLLASYVPARASTRISPAQAMRFDPSVSLIKGSIPWLERMAGRVFHLHTGTKIALRNLVRNRSRTLTTAAGFIFAFVILLACWALFDGMANMLNVQFKQTDRWDLQAQFTQPQSTGVLDEVAAWPGVEIVEPVILLPSTLVSETTSKDLLLTAIAPDTKLHGFQLPRGKTAPDVLLPAQALLPPALGDKLGLDTGDTATIETPLGSRKVRVDTSNREMMSVGIYTDLTWLQDELAGGLELFNGLLLTVDEDEQQAVRKRLYDEFGAANVIYKADSIAGWTELTTFFVAMLGSFLFFALLISAAVIYNTMTINVLERQREIATMRALGQNRGRLWGIVTQENMLIGLMALIPGLVIGTVVTYFLFGLFSASADFFMPFYIAPLSYLLVTILIFGMALLSQIPSMRRINRMNLAEATKVMS
ncbi:MAG: ABC transporter permease [Anaerolineae bacterium]|nr:ABC transporter permease [Anaerolineae bacterium]